MGTSVLARDLICGVAEGPGFRGCRGMEGDVGGEGEDGDLCARQGFDGGGGGARGEGVRVAGEAVKVSTGMRLTGPTGLLHTPHSE